MTKGLPVLVGAQPPSPLSGLLSPGGGMFPMGGAKCCTLLSALVWFPLSPCMGEDQTRPWDEGSRSGAGLGHSWAQQCWQVPPCLFAQVTPPLLLRQGGGSTSEGTAQRCPLLPLPEHPHTRPGPQGLCSAPRCQAEPAVRGVSAGALGPQEGRFALRQRSGAEDCASHRPLPPSLLVAVTVSVQRGNLGTETDPAAPHPSPALV